MGRKRKSESMQNLVVVSDTHAGCNLHAAVRRNSTPAAVRGWSKCVLYRQPCVESLANRMLGHFKFSCPGANAHGNAIMRYLSRSLCVLSLLLTRTRKVT